jgi:putative tryptophan/tyrosine transport system substrate-binding protein
MKRREFIILLGGAAVAWPLAAHAQQPTMPVIGFLNGTSADAFAHARNGFIQGLKESSHIVGQNVAIEYRWAEGQYDRLPALAADLLRRQVAVLVVNNAAAPAAMAATATIPIVFASGADPVKSGLVVSLNRPSSNVTGVYFLIDALPTKNLHLLHELVPQASMVALLVNPNNAVAVGTELPSVQAAARALGLDLVVMKAAAERDIDAAFANVVQVRAGALIVASDSFIFGHRQQIISLAARHSIPTVYPWRDAPSGGGLLSYGTSLTDAYRLAGVYTGRILQGAKPADLPVQQSTKFELVINLKTARALGLNVPDKLLALADEVIE